MDIISLREKYFIFLLWFNNLVLLFNFKFFGVYISFLALTLFLPLFHFRVIFVSAFILSFVAIDSILKKEIIISTILDTIEFNGNVLDSFVKLFSLILLSLHFYRNRLKSDLWVKHFKNSIIIVSICFSAHYVYLNLYSVIEAGRIYSSWMGGPNASGFILALGIIFLSGIQRKVCIFLFMPLILAALVYTQSRVFIVASLLFLLVKMVLLIKKSVVGATFLFLSFGTTCVLFSQLLLDRLFLSFLNMRSDISWLQSVTSGRSVQWFDVIDKLNECGWFCWLFGFGFGNYRWTNSYSFETSVHNIFLQVLYEFGFIFSWCLIVIFFVLLRKIVVGLFGARQECWVVFSLLFGLVFHDLLLTTQLILPVAIVLSFAMRLAGAGGNNVHKV